MNIFKMVLAGFIGIIIGTIASQYITTNNIRYGLEITEVRDTETGLVITIDIEGQEDYYIWDNEKLEGLAQ